MKSLIYSFLGGALVGCAIAILFAPEKGEDTRKRIKDLLKKKGIDLTKSAHKSNNSRKLFYR